MFLALSTDAERSDFIVIAQFFRACIAQPLRECVHTAVCVAFCCRLQIADEFLF